MPENNENEIFENPDVLVEQIDKTEDFIKKNKTIFIGVVAAIVLVVAAGVFWKKSQAANRKEAANAIYVAEDYFRKDSLELALNGDGVNKGFVALADEFSGTSAGTLAQYYIGAIELKSGNFEEAASRFSKYDTDAFLVQARAYALAGDAYSELKNSEEAIKFYEKATQSQPNKEYTPKYLVKLGLAYENANKYSDAVLTYEKYVSDYPNGKKVDDVKKYLAKALILSGKKS